MKFFTLMASVLALCLTLTAPDAEAAKRLGGGKSSGMQREMSTPDRSPGATPSQAPTVAPNSVINNRTASTAAPQAQPKRSWMGPLAGLAAGLGLAALASHFGFGEELASMMMMVLLAVLAVAAVGYFLKRRAAAQLAVKDSTLQYAGAGNTHNHSARAYEAMLPPIGGRSSANFDAGKTPPGFDAASFARNAKIQFIRLQAANDAANLDDLREFTSPEMFAELKMNISERGNSQQHTDVLEINAEVLEVIEEQQRYIASVRFTGHIREDSAPQSDAVDEIWHLTKPVAGGAGWVLAGIQQLN